MYFDTNKSYKKRLLFVDEHLFYVNSASLIHLHIKSSKNDNDILFHN